MAKKFESGEIEGVEIKKKDLTKTVSLKAGRKMSKDLLKMFQSGEASNAEVKPAAKANLGNIGGSKKNMIAKFKAGTVSNVETAAKVHEEEAKALKKFERKPSKKIREMFTSGEATNAEIKPKTVEQLGEDLEKVKVAEGIVKKNAFLEGTAGNAEQRSRAIDQDKELLEKATKDNEALKAARESFQGGQVTSSIEVKKAYDVEKEHIEAARKAKGDIVARGLMMQSNAEVKTKVVEAEAPIRAKLPDTKAWSVGNKAPEAKKEKGLGRRTSISRILTGK
eukprot:UC1_evm1s1885